MLSLGFGYPCEGKAIKTLWRPSYDSSGHAGSHGSVCVRFRAGLASGNFSEVVESMLTTSIVNWKATSTFTPTGGTNIRLTWLLDLDRGSVFSLHQG